jgi:hypothetical protein
VPPGRLRGRETSGRPSALKNYLLRCPPARPLSPRRSRCTARSPPPRHAPAGPRHQPSARLSAGATCGAPFRLRRRPSFGAGYPCARMRAGSSGTSIAPRKPSPHSLTPDATDAAWPREFFLHIAKVELRPVRYRSKFHCDLRPASQHADGAYNPLTNFYYNSLAQSAELREITVS